MTEFQHFLRGYIAALLWSSTDEVDGETVNLDEYAASATFDVKAEADCRAFYDANRADIDLAASLYDTSSGDGADTGYDFAGHDFALTRNHHGAGFWDGDLPDGLAEALTMATRKSGSVTAYLGQDKKVHAL